MKKLILILTAFVALCFTAAAEDIMYVNSPDGLRVRSEPSLSAKILDTLYYGEYVIVGKIGDEATIDGITANWINVDFFDEDEFPERNGWVFGGYLSRSEPDLGNTVDFIKSCFKNSRKRFFLAPYFPDEEDTVYPGNEDDWDFDCALENLCQKDYYPENKGVTLRECLFYMPPVAANNAGYLSILPAGTKLQLSKTEEYGIKDGVLFPIYEFYCEDPENEGCSLWGHIRGIDITGIQHVSSVSDGKGGCYTLYYQRALKYLNGRNHEKVKEALDNTWTYEGAYLRDGFRMNAVLITDPDGDCHDAGDIGTDANTLELEYPLNMKEPVLFLKENHFYGGMGGGYFSTKLYTAEPAGSLLFLREAFEYGYTSADAGYDGMAYHYFTNSGAVVYEYQTDETGNVERNRQRWYVLLPDSSYVMKETYTTNGEPEPKRTGKLLKKGQYVNPVCRLKMRSAPNLYADKINTLKAGTLLQIIEVGSKATIDGISSSWVRVESVNKGRFVEGYSTEDVTGWVFGGYLE